MLLLIAAIAVLAIAPVLYRLTARQPATLAGIDGFVFASVLGLVVLVILPESVAASGWIAVAGAVIGFLGPTYVERRMSSAAAQTHRLTMLLAMGGLALHAFIDGIALAQGPAGGQTQQMLAVAVVVHRIPVALTIWTLLRPRHGLGRAAAALLAVALATAAGYLFGDAAFVSAQVLVVQAVVAGSLLHVIVHRPHLGAAPTVSGWRLYDGIGALLGVLVVAAMLHLGEAHSHGPALAAHAHDAHGHDETILATFLALAAQSAPALLLAYLGAGLIHALLPQASVRWMSRGGSASRAIRGMVFGLPLPICSCGVIPLYRTLIQRGVPAAAGLAFLVATPEIGIDAVLLSTSLLGTELTVARVVAAAVVALLVGWAIGRTIPEAVPAPGATDEHDSRSGAGVGPRVVAGLRVGLGELVDATGPWILLGLAVAAVAAPAIEGSWLVGLPAGVDVLLFALIGMPTYVCASGVTPLVATLVAGGVSPGAALALLLTGPATNVTTFGVLSALHGRRVALAFGALVAAAAVSLGYLTNALLAGRIHVFEAHGHHHELGLLPMVALAALGLLLLLSLTRQGPRGFTGQIIATGGDACCDACHTSDAAGDSCCGDGHDHDDHGHDDHGAGGCCH